MTLTRRNVAAVGDTKPRSSSLWEDEANEYWKEMEPAKRCTKISKHIICLLAVLAAGTGGVMIARGTWSSVADLRERFTLSATTDTSSENTTASTAATSSSTMPASASAPVSSMATNPALINNQAAVDLLRARCRVRGVQTRWHEETCQTLCASDPQNSACMNGCSYGSITVTKLTCDEMAVAEIPTTTQCPDGVSCKMACKTYDTEQPFPDMRNSCERSCATIVPSSCSRILQIYRDLYRGTLQ